MTIFKSSLIRQLLALASATPMLFAALSAQAAQPPAAYMTATRYNANHLVTGSISPSVDGSTYLARRNIYNTRGLLARAEQGWLTAWMDESRDPAQDWTNYFHLVQATAYTYDDLGRKLTEAVVAGDSTVATFTQYSYDNLNQVTCKTLRMNIATEAAPADACTLSATTGLEVQDRVTKFAYNGLGQILTETRAYGTALQQAYVTDAYLPGGLLGDETDANGNRTHLTYDTMSRLATMTFPSQTTAGQVNSSDYEQYGYDLNGNRTSLRKRDGSTIQYDFDALNRVVDEIYPASTIANVYYGYDLRGLKLYARFSSTTGPGLTSSYDGFGRLVTSSTNQSGAARTLSYQFDADGDRTRVTHPDASYFQYQYDGLDRLSTIRESGATALITQTFDLAGRLGSLQRGSNVAGTNFVYDGVSRIKTLSQDLQGTSYDESRTFDYNSASQIVSKLLSNPVYQYSQAPTVTTSYSVNGLNEYTQFTAGATVSTRYDANANMTSDGSSTFNYDVLNRMISASGAHTVALSYDPLGRLFQTSGGASGTTQFLYDGDALVAEYDGTGTMLRRYVHGAGVDEPLVAYEGTSVGVANRRYFHVDQQGSIMALSDANGNELRVNTYDSYGIPSTSNFGAFFTRFQYTGQIMLPDLGQYYYKARIYNPAIGRFMQTDPIGYKDDEDLYSYAGNDPIDRSDPTGMFDPANFANWLRLAAAEEVVGLGPEDPAADAVAGVTVAVGAITVAVISVVSADSDKSRAARVDAAAGRDRTSSAPKPAAAADAPASTPRSLKATTEVGDRVKTPDNSPADFTKLKGGQGSVDNKTGTVFQKSNTNHSNSPGGEWKAGPRPGVTPTPSTKVTITGGEQGGCVIKKDGC